MKIVFLDAQTVNPGDLSWEALKDEGELVIHSATSTQDLVHRAQGFDIVITNKCKMTAEVIAKLSPTLGCICVAATGYDNIDLSAAKKHRVGVSNVAGYSTESVTQHVFALLLSMVNEPERYSSGVQAGRWAHSDHFAYTGRPIRSLSSMTMGIVGLGTIGQSVAKVALALGMKVVATRKSSRPSPLDGVELVDVQTLAQESDVISLHVPATSETTDLVRKEFLSLLREDAILINTARGALIDEAALYAWLSSHPKAKAGLDVMRSEPPQQDHPLYGRSNCIITPHQAWMGVTARQRLLDGLVQNIKDFKAGTMHSLS